MAVALSLLDMAAYRAQRVLDRVVVAQVTWLLETPPELDRVRMMADRLAASSLLGRVVVPAPIFGARDHWGPLPDRPEVVIEASPIERAEVLAWVGQRGAVPVDPTREPWHLAVQPFTDGGHAVTLVVSHTLTDGSGLVTTLGVEEPPAAIPARRYAGGRTGGLAGIREAIAGIPAAVRASRRASRTKPVARAAHAQPVMAANRRALDVVACVDSSVWHEAATELGGSASTLFLSVAAQAAATLGRVAEDGTAQLCIPVGHRAPGDDLTGNALSAIQLNIPIHNYKDLPFIRAELKRILIQHGHRPDPLTATVPVIPYLPRRAVPRIAHAALGSGIPVVTASNVGVLPQPFVDAPGPAAVVFLNVGVQYGGGPRVPERISTVYTETSFAQAPGGNVALHVSVTSDGATEVGQVRGAVAGALAALGVRAREIL